MEKTKSIAHSGKAILLSILLLIIAAFAFMNFSSIGASKVEAASGDWLYARVTAINLTSGTYYKQQTTSSLTSSGASASDFNVHFDETTNTLTLKDLGKSAEFTGKQGE